MKFDTEVQAVFAESDRLNRQLNQFIGALARQMLPGTVEASYVTLPDPQARQEEEDAALLRLLNGHSRNGMSFSHEDTSFADRLIRAEQQRGADDAMGGAVTIASGRSYTQGLTDSLNEIIDPARHGGFVTESEAALADHEARRGEVFENQRAVTNAAATRPGSSVSRLDGSDLPGGASPAPTAARDLMGRDHAGGRAVRNAADLAAEGGMTAAMVEELLQRHGQPSRSEFDAFVR